jgi:hypothetical protein
MTTTTTGPAPTMPLPARLLEHWESRGKAMYGARLPAAKVDRARFLLDLDRVEYAVGVAGPFAAILCERVPPALVDVLPFPAERWEGRMVGGAFFALLAVSTDAVLFSEGYHKVLSGGA